MTKLKDITMPDNKMFSLMPVEKLVPYKNNARTHSEKQIQQVANSIKQFGFTAPVLVDSNNQILAGHCRVLAAKVLGMKEVPVISITHLSSAEARAYIIADNRLAEKAGWDNELLKIEFKELSALSLDFDLEITGFETAEIDLVVDNDVIDENMADEVLEVDEGPAITKPGDVWELGSHLLICGNSIQNDTYQRLMGGKKADMVFTDPPYNVPISGHVCGNGKIKHKEFAMASGEMTDSQFAAFLESFCDNASRYSRDGSLHYICMDWRHIAALLSAGKEFYSELKNICVWNKDNGGMGSLYRSKHELIAVFKHGTKPHLNNIELGKHGRYRTNVWDYKGVNSFGKNQSDLKMHPTVKPVAMIVDAIKDCTKRGQILLDPFAGSGSTLIAAEKTGRVARCIELDPHYCDVIVRRWQDYTGKWAVNIDTGEFFNNQKKETKNGK